MAESAKRVWPYSGGSFIYNQLSDAGKTKLCRSCVYHRGRILSGNGSYRWKERFYTGNWKSSGTGRIWHGSGQNRHQRRSFCYDRIRTWNRIKCCRYCHWCRKIRCNQSLFLSWRMRWSKNWKKLLYRVCKTDTDRFHHFDSGLWKISL